MSHRQVAEVALSTPSLLVGGAIAAFALFTNYVVWFARPPHCEMMCPLMALTPTATSVLWSAWLLAWVAPAWGTLGGRKRLLAASSVVATSASLLMFCRWL